MYQRSYYPSEEQVVCPPREYDGSINFEKEEIKSDTAECRPSHRPTEKRKGGLPFFDIFPIHLFGGLELGLEELLIIGAAVFLFMSKSGDFECIFILIALIFIQ